MKKMPIADSHCRVHPHPKRLRAPFVLTFLNLSGPVARWQHAFLQIGNWQFESENHCCSCPTSWFICDTSKKPVKSVCPASVSRVLPSTRILTRLMPGIFADSVSVSDATVNSSSSTPERWVSENTALVSITASPGSTRYTFRISDPCPSGCGEDSSK